MIFEGQGFIDFAPQPLRKHDDVAQNVNTPSCLGFYSLSFFSIISHIIFETA
jgi:hypothetical protein